MCLYVLISTLIYFPFTVSFYVIMWSEHGAEVQQRPFSKHILQHMEPGLESIQRWTVWISFNLASCWFDGDCNRTHYTLSVRRRSLCLFPASLCLTVIAELIFLFLCVHMQGEQIKGAKIAQQRETETWNWNRCDHLLTDVFCFRLRAVFRLLCNELATRNCNYKFDIEQKEMWKT